MRHLARTIPLAVVAIVCLTGCSVSYPFQLLLTVKNAEDGKPIEGATGVLDALAVDEHESQLDYGRHRLPATDTQGRLTYDFSLTGSSGRFLHWHLKLQKEGFEPVVVSIWPNEPNSPRELTSVPVVVELKLLPKKP
jgi:hypothetical protein